MRLIIVVGLATCVPGCVWIDVPPHLPDVDVVTPVDVPCSCGNGICEPQCHETPANCFVDCPDADAN